MKNKIKKVSNLFKMFGFDFEVFILTIINLPSYINDYLKMYKLSKTLNDKFGKLVLYPCLLDRKMQSGTGMGHYFYQDLYIASRVFKNKPMKHLDVGSRVDGFVAHVASFRKITVGDIRPLKSIDENIEFLQVDFMDNLPEKMIGAYDSISCLHALEHFGLGRYGDKLNINGHKIGLDNIMAALKIGGKLYISVPMGKLRIEFNAHRVFSLESILDLLENRVEICNFSYVDDNGNIHKDVDLNPENISKNMNCYYGLAILEMNKL